jgi:ATP-dependent Clp protease ATP-binding subunit ClpB
MRTDKLTTAFQQALADAQSLAVGYDSPTLEPLHVLAALLGQEEGATRSLLARAGANLQKLSPSVNAGLEGLPKVSKPEGQVTVGSELVKLFNLTDREAQSRGDQFIASELFLLPLADDKGIAGRLLRDSGLTRKNLELAIQAVRGGQSVNAAARQRTD